MPSHRHITPASGGATGLVSEPATTPAFSIGKIEVVTGSCTLTRSGDSPVQIKHGDTVCQGDIIETSSGGKVCIRFIDGTVFDLSDRGRMVVKDFASQTAPSATFDIRNGTFTFIAGEMAKAGQVDIDTPFGRIRGRPRTGGIGMLSLASFFFAAMEQVHAAPSDTSFLDDGNIRFKDLTSDYGVIELTTADGRTIVLDDPGETVVLRKVGSSVSESHVTNSVATMLSYENDQANALRVFALGPSGPAGNGSNGSSTPPPALPPLVPINFTPPTSADPPHASLAGLNGSSTSDFFVPFIAPPPLPPPPPGPAASATAEIPGQTGIPNTDTATGSLAFSGVSIGDPSFVWSGGSLPGAQQTSLPSESHLAFTGPGSTGFSFTIPDSALDFLAQNETLTVVYPVTLTDGNGNSLTQQVIVTLTGANDLPMIGVETLSGEVTEKAHTTTETTSGTIAFHDVDLTDTHVASAVFKSTDYSSQLGTLSAVISNDTTGSGAGGLITWTFTANDSALEQLAAGQTVHEIYTVTLNDQHGGVISQDITITITGTEDAPVITVGGGDSTTKTLAKTDAALSTSGTLTVTDVDLSDAVNPSVVSVVASGTTTGLGSDNAALKAMLSVTPGSIAANPGDTNNLNWSFNSTPGAFSYLAAGEKLTLTYTVKATDSQSVDSNPQTVTIVITGSEDAPVISVVGVDSTTKTLAESNAALSTSGTLTVTDANLSDTVSPSVVSVVASDTTTGLGSDNAALKAMLSVTPGSIAANPGDTNNLNWSFNSTPEAFNYLAAGQKLTLTYTVKADDSQSVDSNPQTVTIVITGSEDAPVISVGGVDSTTKTLAETNAALSTSGTLTVTDVDLSDAVNPSVVSVVASDTTTGLGSDHAALKAMLSVTPGSIAANPGDANNLNWSFNSTPEAFNYLAAGQKLTLTYTVKATTARRDSNPQTVTIVVTGTEDAPVISVVGVDSTTKTLAESNAALSTSGTLTVTDVDLSDSGDALGGVGGGLRHDHRPWLRQRSAQGDAVGDAWLDRGQPGRCQQPELVVQLDTGSLQLPGGGPEADADLHGQGHDSQSVDSNPQTVTIVITGSEDAPVISVVGVDSTTKTLAKTNAALSTSGTLTVTDVDLSDAVTPSVVSVVASDTTTGLGSDNAALRHAVGVAGLDRGQPGRCQQPELVVQLDAGSLQLPGGGPEADADLHGQGRRQPGVTAIRRR